MEGSTLHLEKSRPEKLSSDVLKKVDYQDVLRFWRLNSLPSRTLRILKHRRRPSLKKI
jgi:hypothetical protein